MAFHRFITIDGTRHDITDLETTPEHSCDRCGRYVSTWTDVEVDGLVLNNMPGNAVVELCAACVRDYFPGLVDLANKVLGRV